MFIKVAYQSFLVQLLTNVIGLIACSGKDYRPCVGLYVDVSIILVNHPVPESRSHLMLAYDAIKEQQLRACSAVRR